ncbi:MAG: 23S rRNA (pseudouridine(1915)-N(3))-methyltransferase RlmH [Deltaproteobacteria bacterium]|nr:23S rRNA (pseudouridine(1915)-N(3))-methyltransferase RlmH [Deltaproteobacteria bacterium]
MKFTIVTIGKIKENFILEGIQDYHKRISRYTQMDLFPVKEERMTNGVSGDLILQKEGKRILSKIPRDGLWVVLDRQGQELSSRNHFDFLNAQSELGVKKIYYLIGGPLGFSTEVLEKADKILSLSRMTFTHEMSALLLVEQLYRYLNFMAGEKYHK